jgi:hypothetical protein
MTNFLVGEPELGQAVRQPLPTSDASTISIPLEPITPKEGLTEGNGSAILNPDARTAGLDSERKPPTASDRSIPCLIIHL